MTPSIYLRILDLEKEEIKKIKNVSKKGKKLCWSHTAMQTTIGKG